MIMVNISLNHCRGELLNPAEFISMLNAVRVDRLTPEVVQAFKQLERAVGRTDSTRPTELYVKATIQHAYGLLKD